MGNYTNRHFPKEFVKKYEFEMQNTLCGIIELCTVQGLLKNPLTQQDIHNSPAPLFLVKNE